MVTKIFLDVNILMEVIFSRKKSKQCLELIVSNLGNIYISSLSVHICNYFLKKEGKSVKENSVFFTQFDIHDLNSSLLDETYNIYTKDFEDAIQVASFLKSDCVEFYTLDKQMKQNYGQIAKIVVL